MVSGVQATVSYVDVLFRRLLQDAAAGPLPAGGSGARPPHLKSVPPISWLLHTTKTVF